MSHLKAREKPKFCSTQHGLFKKTQVPTTTHPPGDGELYWHRHCPGEDAAVEGAEEVERVGVRVHHGHAVASLDGVRLFSGGRTKLFQSPIIRMHLKLTY